MNGAFRKRSVGDAIGAAAIALTVALGVLLRLEDPLSSPVVPAEDPYTHMVLVREHLRTGTLEPLNPPGGLYPPGMHALVAAVWTFTGTGLYQLVRFLPTALGGIGVLGVGVLLWRHVGRVGAFVGAMGFAVAPEVVFRTTMMAPTALDLALLPFFFFALLEVLAGRLLWVGVAAPLAVYLVFAHPWLFAILAAMGVAFALLALVFPWPAPRSPSPSSPGFAACTAIVGGGLGLVLSTCAGMCGNGFAGVLPYADLLVLLSPVVLVVSFLPSVLLAVRSEDPGRWVPDRTDGPRSLFVRGAVALVLAVALVALTWPAVEAGMPHKVELPRMIGWPLLGLAALGFVGLSFVASPLAYLGAGLALVTYPNVIYNPLDSEFWPHRTVVYFAVGIAILAGVAAGRLTSWLSRVWNERVTAPRFGTSGKRALVALVPALLVAGSLGGAVFAETPPNYPDGWYRVYEPCEMGAMQEIAETANAEPRAVVVTADWRAGIVLSAITDDADRIWFKETFFASEREREDAKVIMDRQDKPLYVVEERYLRSQTPAADAGFLNSEEWRVVATWCSEELNPRHQVVLHKLREGSR